jgi:hypothetical protein
MAAKSVKVEMRNHPLSREENGVTFHVAVSDGRFGELIVSKGGLRWKPKGKQDHHFMSWSRLDTLMRDAPKR